VREGISELIGLSDLAILHEAAGHLFKNPGKMIRSKIIMLLARSLINKCDHKKALTLAICTEMSHTASLLHDDVIDESNERRGRPSASATFGNKLAILAGDFLFSRALRHLTVNVAIDQVTANVSQVLENLTKGEVVQMSPNGNALVDGFDISKRDEVLKDVLSRYNVKTFLKTASLFSLTCKSVATIADAKDKQLEYYAQTFGQHFGMAFQLIDDLLDFKEEETDDAKKLGKPVGQDLKLGLATLPVILAAKRYPEELIPLILRNFSFPGDVDTAMQIVMSKSKDNKKAFAEAREVIREHIGKAIGCLLHFPENEWRNELIQLVAKYNGY
jgi:geranylgeranyl pyrophosphate synthase